MTDNVDNLNLTVHVVDDDERSRRGISELVRTMMKLECAEYESAQRFLDDYDGTPGILVSDIWMPSMTGLELQQELSQRDLYLPVVIVTAFPKVGFVVEAVSNGAVAVLEKPFKSDELWLAIRKGVSAYRAGYSRHRKLMDTRERLRSLTEAERDVLKLMMKGVANKAAARQLNISVRTVEARRKRILEKMDVESIAELVRKVILAEPDID